MGSQVKSHMCPYAHHFYEGFFIPITINSYQSHCRKNVKRKIYDHLNWSWSWTLNSSVCCPFTCLSKLSLPHRRHTYNLTHYITFRYIPSFHSWSSFLSYCLSHNFYYLRLIVFSCDRNHSANEIIRASFSSPTKFYIL